MTVVPEEAIIVGHVFCMTGWCDLMVTGIGLQTMVKQWECPDYGAGAL